MEMNGNLPGETFRSWTRTMWGGGKLVAFFRFPFQRFDALGEILPVGGEEL